MGIQAFSDVSFTMDLNVIPSLQDINSIVKCEETKFTKWFHKVKIEPLTNLVISVNGLATDGKVVCQSEKNDLLPKNDTLVDARSVNGGD